MRSQETYDVWRQATKELERETSEWLWGTNLPPSLAGTELVIRLGHARREIGVSSQGHIIQSVKDRPRLKDSGLVAWEAPWRESKTAEPSDKILGKEYEQCIRL